MVWDFPKHKNLSDGGHDLQPCAEDDPNRCQGIHSQTGAQCRYLAIPNTQKCPAHTINPKQMGLYNLKRTTVLNRLEQLKKNPEGKSLVVELGILRLTLEELLNKCGDDQWAFAINQGPITTMISTIRDTLTANIKIEKHIGELLSVGQVVEIAQDLFNIVSKYIPDANALECIAREFEGTLAKARPDTSPSDVSKYEAQQ